MIYKTTRYFLPRACPIPIRRFPALVALVITLTARYRVPPGNELACAPPGTRTVIL
jgi:hypothetical protein